MNYKCLFLVVLILISFSCKKEEEKTNPPPDPPANIVLEKPSVDFNYSLDGLNVNFESVLENATRVEWDFGNGNSSDEFNPTQVYDRSSRYWITLVAYNDSTVGDSTYSASKEYKEPIRVSVIDHVRWGSKIDPLNGVTISWRNNTEADKIKWGYTESMENGVFDPLVDNDLVGYFNKHEFTFDALTPSSTIYYSLYDSGTDEWTEVNTFKTAVDPANNHFKFTAGGDSRTVVNDWNIVSKAIEVTDFSLYLGDIVNSGGSNKDWEAWYYHGVDFISKNLSFHIRGNHDAGTRFPNNLVNPGNGLYYSFEFGNSIFIGLDDYYDETWPEQTAFLEEVLEANQDKTWKFLFFHSPFFTSEGHAGEMDTLRSTWWKLFDDYGVDIIYNGHEHTYLRTVPINLSISDSAGVAEYGSNAGQGRCEIISGCYGAPLYSPHEGWFVDNSFARLHYTTTEVNGTELTFKAIDAETGEVFDELILSK
ncbi:MAG: hypothetical protein DRI89_12455 [Bacteroidetes bacterium]|nr:MAG: hypothetical protein DRI89_12455 [Bacteroidota bacterium]